VRVWSINLISSEMNMSGHGNVEWATVDPRNLPASTRWTPCEIVLQWFQGDRRRHRIARAMESEALASIVDQTNWNGTGLRFCATIHHEGKDKLIFAVVQDDGRTFASLDRGLS